MFGIIVRGILMGVLLVAFVPAFLVTGILIGALALHSGITHGDCMTKEDWNEIKDLIGQVLVWIRTFVLDG